MKKEYTQLASYPLRLEPELRNRLEAVAKANGRSLNTQISMMLEASLNGEVPPVGAHPDTDIQSMMREIALQTVREELARQGKG